MYTPKAWTPDLSSIEARDTTYGAPLTTERAEGKAMSAVIFDGGVIEGTNNLRYPGVHFDRLHADLQTDCGKKGLPTMQARAAGGIEKLHLFLLYPSVVLGVTGCN